MKNPINLIMLPGLLCDASLFSRQAEALADIAQVTVADLTLADSIPAMAQETLEKSPDGPLVLVGMSMGGYVAFEMFRQATDRIHALCLISTSADPETPTATSGREELIAKGEDDLPAVVETLLARMAHPAKANEREIGGVFQSMATGLGQEVFERQQHAIMARADSRPLLAEIHCPTLVISGHDDQVIPLAVQRRMAEGITGAEHKIFDDCGHLIPLEAADQLTDTLREWLERIS